MHRKSWKRFAVTYRDGEGAVHVVVENPHGCGRGVASVAIDGRDAPDRSIVLTGAKGTREVRVVMAKP